MSIDPDSTLPALRVAVHAHAPLRLLVLHGSRARGDARDDSDWDFAYAAAPELDVGLLYADLALALRSDHVDLVDLTTAGGLIRYRVARDGIVVLEREAGLFDKFWFDAVSFWCDARTRAARRLQRAPRKARDMSLDLDVLAERAALVERHLARVAQKLPATPAELASNTDASDAVILHLWQATQIALDVALGVCARPGSRDRA